MTRARILEHNKFKKAQNCFKKLSIFFLKKA